jgi:hypothetical protein
VSQNENYKRSSRYFDLYGFYHGGIMPVKKGNFWGYINRKEIKICELKYDYAYPFFENRGLVRLNNRYGFLTEDGFEIIPTFCEKAFSFRNGAAILVENNRYGYLDKYGYMITKLKYDYAYDFF